MNIVTDIPVICSLRYRAPHFLGLHKTLPCILIFSRHELEKCLISNGADKISNANSYSLVGSHDPPLLDHMIHNVMSQVVGSLVCGRVLYLIGND